MAEEHSIQKADELKEELKSAETKNNSLPQIMENEDLVDEIILKTAKQSTVVKDVIDLAATKSALERQETVDKIVEEKTKELTTDAEAKRIKAETDKVREEVAKVKQEMEKELAELNKSIEAKKKEIEELDALADKSKAFFNNNKIVLKCVGVTSPLALKAMQWLMIPASVLFTLFQVILLPLHLIGFLVESITNIVNSICGNFAKGSWKIIATIASVGVIIGLAFGLYYLIVWLFTLI